MPAGEAQQGISTHWVAWLVGASRVRHTKVDTAAFGKDTGSGRPLGGYCAQSRAHIICSHHPAGRAIKADSPCRGPEGRLTAVRIPLEAPMTPPPACLLPHGNRNQGRRLVADCMTVLA